LTGKSVEDCESCHPGYALTQGACESPCITGQYAKSEVNFCSCAVWHAFYFIMFMNVITWLVISLQEQGYNCESCDESCLECKGPGHYNCTICPAQLILTAEGRCLPCCTNTEQEDTAPVQQECCNCTQTRGSLFGPFQNITCTNRL